VHELHHDMIHDHNNVTEGQDTEKTQTELT